MINELNINVNVNGRDYFVEIDAGKNGVSRGRLRIVDSELGLEVADLHGICNPLVGFWGSADNLLRGAARAAKIKKIIRLVVGDSLKDLARLREEIIECGDEVPAGMSKVLAAAGL